MKLYTRRGDDGTTSLFDGSSVRKDDPRVTAYGTLDELNACIGVAVALMRRSAKPDALRQLVERLTTIQSELFQIGADLATPEGAVRRDRVPEVSPEDVRRLESWIDDAGAATPPIACFVLPGGDPAAAQLHVCRTVCRRAEREIVALAADQTVNPQIVIYMNRLSDLLFAWARWVNHHAGAGDVPWVKGSRGQGAE